jgi:hypothetical protein
MHATPPMSRRGAGYVLVVSASLGSVRTPDLLGQDGLIAVGGGVAVAVGVAAAAGVVATLGWRYGPAVGWIAAVTVYLVWTWMAVGRLDPQRTASPATREDPTRSMTDVIVVSASVASLVGVRYLLAGGLPRAATQRLRRESGSPSWSRPGSPYIQSSPCATRLYYVNDAGGIDFNQGDDPPAYVDFAYLAFTIGMGQAERLASPHRGGVSALPTTTSHATW